MKNTALAFKETRPVRKEIELSLRDRFPVCVKIKDESNNVIGTYLLVKTKNNGFMLQK